MNGLLNFLEAKVAPFGDRVGNQRHLKAIREGFMMAMPLILVGSIFLILISWPSESFISWLAKIGVLDVLTSMNQSTVAIVSLVACFGIAYRLAEGYEVDGPSAGVLALSSFILMAPRFSTEVLNDKGDKVMQTFAGAIPFTSLNANALFLAITIGLITAEIYRVFIQKGFTIKMPDGVPDVVSKSFSALIPGFTAFVFWACILKGLEALHVPGGLGGLLGVIVGTPLELVAGTLPGMILCVIINSFFWFCGVNGGQVVQAFVDPVWLKFTTENQELVAAGKAAQHIITLPFKDLFVFIGGGGATIGLALCLFLFSKSKTNKTLGKLAIIPSIFNINTAILFTLPTVLNPIMLIPFVLTPTINALVTYFAMATGLVPLTTGVILPWTMPPIIGGFLATGASWQGAVLQAILIVISFAIYYPFFKVADHGNLMQEQGETK